ncbi:MAG: anaerobic ribonucleoside-triphosphate reductase activating protein [Coriobacteriia bacterium]|nr:anaerobic ribonucleoside-triphosphate reductase activating protein [Coriobacteriia bacterium]
MGSEMIRLFGTVDDSIVDGPGIRFAIFVQGCPHLCPGCHNPQAQPTAGGTMTSLDALMARIEANPLISGVTFSGGEPFEQPEPLIALARWVRQYERTDKGGNKRPPLTIWAYSGYTFEQLITGTPSAQATKLLSLCDVLVDGPFIQAQASYLLKWRGSANQRIIDVPASLAAGNVLLWQA